MYFLDAGLAAWLAGWRDPESLRLGPLAGAIFETHVFGQLLRHFRHRAREVEITFWRTRDGEEVDFLVETAGRVTPIEVKLGTPNGRALPKLDRLAESNWLSGRVVTLTHLTPTLDPIWITEGWKAASPLDLTFLEGN
jgi:predicted AAA+ superfamily ATPase